LCFTSEEALAHLPRATGEYPSVHQAYYPQLEAQQMPAQGCEPAALQATRAAVQAAVPQSLACFAPLMAVRREANLALEKARTQGRIGASIQAMVKISVRPQDLVEGLAWQLDPAFWADFLIVSQAEVAVREGALEVQVEPAAGHRCGRCWLIRAHLGHSAEHPSLCSRCVEALRNAT
ncbi:MAG: hypothetical protein EOO40_07245, partial [Deltaproteobacteria bacterium]